jgi:hypothetical protein
MGNVLNYTIYTPYINMQRFFKLTRGQFFNRYRLSSAEGNIKNLTYSVIILCRAAFQPGNQHVVPWVCCSSASAWTASLPGQQRAQSDEAEERKQQAGKVSIGSKHARLDSKQEKHYSTLSI